MAQLKDTTIQGSARVTDTLYSNAVQAKIFNIPTASNGTTYGPGTDGQVLKSNGASVYWASDSNSDINVKQLAAITTSGAYPIILANSTATTEVTGTVNKSANLTYNPSTKALSTGGTINGLTFTAASTGFTIAGGTTSKTLTVSNTYTLGAACAKGVTDNSSNADVTSSDTNLITGRTLYYQLAKKGYTTNTGTVTSVQVQASSPLQSSTSTAQSATLSTTISFTNQDPNKVLAGPSSGSSAGAPSFRALVAADIPSLDWSKIGSGKPTTLSGYGITDAAASDHTQAVNKGGTNITSYTTGDILYASGSTTLAKLAGNTTTTKKFLKSVATTSGTAVAPAWDTLAAADIPNLDWSKITSGKPTTLSGYGITDAAASGHTQAVNKGGTNIASYTKGDILYASAATTLSKLAIGTAGKFLKATADGPAWDSLPTASSSAAGIAKLGASGGAATYDHTHSGYVSKSGDTVNGVLVANNFVSKYGVEFQNSSGTNVGGIFQDMEGANQFYMDEYTTSGVRECYLLPTPNATSTSFYDILTSKNAVTVAQGGTGATTAAGARTNLGLGSMAVASTADYVAKAGDTMTGVLRAPSFFSTDNESTGYNGLSFTSGTNVVKARIYYTQTDNVSSHLVFGQDSADGTTYACFHLPEKNVNEDFTIATTADLGSYLPLAGGDMTGTIKLAATAGLRTNNDAGWTMNQYGNITHLRSNTSDTVGIAAYDGSIKFKVAYDSGNTDVTGYLAAAGGVYATNGALVSRSAQPTLYFQNASAQAIGEVFVAQNHLYFRTHPSAGSSNYTDYIFSGATSGGNYSRYIYSTANFSLSGTTLTITPPGW